jgi:hypothetical protein
VRLVQLFTEDLKLEQQLSCARRVFFMEAGDLMHDFCSQEKRSKTCVPDPGSGAFLASGSRNPGWVKNQDPD